MKLILFLLACLVAHAAFAQLNYSHTNARFVNTAYTDISSTGTAITMTNNESGNSTTPVNLGFSFSFNGTVFTQCMIHADGILRFGTVAPGAHTGLFGNNGIASGAVFTTTNSAYQNIVMPFFMDLVQGTATPQFHVLTEGTAPNRITTIQWKNLKDNNNIGLIGQSQYENTEFQVKLFEGSNNIQFVYGTFTTSANVALVRHAQAGIKAGSTSFIGLKRYTTVIHYSLSDFIDPTAHGSQNAGFPISKLQAPQPGNSFLFYGRVTNDIAITESYVDAVLAKNATMSIQNRVRIKNEGTAAAGNINVTMDITGANTFSQTITITSLASGENQVVEFSGYPITNTGLQLVKFTATVATDDNPANNEQTKYQQVGSSFTQLIADSFYHRIGIGFNTASNNELAMKVLGTGSRKLMQVRVKFVSYLVPVVIKILEDDGAGNIPGTVLHSSPTIITNEDNEVLYNLPAGINVTGNYYVSILQTITVNMGVGMALQYPIQPNRYYNGSSTGVYTVPPVDNGFTLMVKTVEENSAADVGIVAITSPLCGYGTAEPVKAVLRNYTSAIHDFAANPVSITGTAHNAATNTSVPFTVIKNSGTLAGNATDTVTLLNSYDFSRRTTHTFTAKTILPGDAEPLNDSITYRILSHIRVSKSFVDSVCPFTPVTVTIPTAIYSSIKWTLNGVDSFTTTTVNLTPTQNTSIYIKATDYRGCELTDSTVVPVRTQGLPPTPVISFTDTLLSFRNGFRDTLSVPLLSGHEIIWSGTGTAPILNSPNYFVSGFQSQLVSRQLVYYRNNSSACGSNAASVNIHYAPGIVMNNNNPETVCDTSFYDPGGATGSPGGVYTSTSSFIKTFYPASPGKKIKISFYFIGLGTSSTIRIYDGENTSAPLLLTFTGTNSSVLQEFTASGSTGALTISFAANGSTGTGWLAGIRCVQPLQFITAAAGAFTNVTIWRSKLPGETTYSAATRIPNKGDDSIIVVHNVGLPASTTIQIDQLIIEPGSTLNVPNNTSLNLYTEDGSYAIDVRGRLQAFGPIFNNGVNLKGKIQLSGFFEINGNTAIDCDSIVINPTPNIPEIRGNGRIGRLKMNSPAGAIVDNTFELKISRLLELEQGIITINATGAINMEAPNSSEIIGGSQASHVDGKLRRETFITSTPLEFPIGKNGLYRKIELLPVQTSFDFAVQYEAELIHTAPPVRTMPGTITNVNQQWFHKLRISGGPPGFFTSATVTIHYETSDGVSSNTKIAKDDGSTSWIDLGGTPTGLQAGSITSNSFTSFSDFVLANVSGTIPVRLISFTGNKQNNDAVLQWQTASEINASHFEIQRSDDGTNFNSIGTVTPGQTNYRYTDFNIFNSKQKVFYRLKMVDKDSSAKYSSILLLSSQSITGITIYPNPVNNVFTVTGLQPGNVVRILDTGGKLLQQLMVQGQSVLFDISKLPAGIYMLQYGLDSNWRIHKIIKQ